jgi:hypothetical protein
MPVREECEDVVRKAQLKYYRSAWKVHQKCRKNYNDEPVPTTLAPPILLGKQHYTIV